MKFLPKSLQYLKWQSPYTLSSNSYKQLLILTHKHGYSDWCINSGWLEPTNNYTDYKIYAKPNGLSKNYPDVLLKLNEIIAVYVIENYGSLYDEY